MTFDPEKLKQIIEGALLAAGKPLNMQRLQQLFEETEPRPGREEIEVALEDIEAGTANHGFELVKVASGYRLQVRQEFAPWVNRLWEEKPQRYSRALLETLALVAYRQPITRGEIEDIRGVAVSTNIIRTLLDRDWVRVVGHREVPGKPAMYATTRVFLDYFNLKSLDELPSLAELRDLENISAELDFADAPPVVTEAANSDQTVAAVDEEVPGGETQPEPQAATEAETQVETDAGPINVEEQAAAEVETGDDRDLPDNVIELPTS